MYWLELLIFIKKTSSKGIQSKLIDIGQFIYCLIIKSKKYAFLS